MFKNILRLGIIKSVNYAKQTAFVMLIDRPLDQPKEMPLLHPAAMNSSGIFVSPVEGTLVLTGYTYREALVIVAYLANGAYSQDLTNSLNTTNFNVGSVPYPKLKQGEIAIQGNTGSNIAFSNDGNINLSFSKSKICYTKDDSLLIKTSNVVTSTSGGREINGIVMRDMRKQTRRIEEVYDKLTSSTYNDILTTVARNPNLTRSSISNIEDNLQILRNPALVENREIIYEYAIEDNVGSLREEKERLLGKDILKLEEPGRRDMSRADSLNLNPTFPNNLIETIKGTVVDIYGNMVDLNRNIISYNNLALDNPNRLELEDKLARRSIKYHFEINSKKKPASNSEFTENGFLLEGEKSSLEKIGYNHSRWSIDVDGEGLTKINIPASTDTGNIPLLTRYSNSNIRRKERFEENDEYKNENFRDPENPTVDILHMGFGDTVGDGVSVPTEYAPANFGDRFSEDQIRYRTAYHDILTTSKALISNNAISSSINNSLEGLGNAGGRSLHMNTDGSIEMNIGKDNVDGKSLVQDLAGGIISRIGKDVNSNSLVSQFDGNINIQVGGDSIETESKVTSPGVNFYVAHGDNFHKIEINSQGVFITSANDSNIVIDSSKNLVLRAKGKTLLHGKEVNIYGNSDETGDTITGERLIERSGKKIH